MKILNKNLLSEDYGNIDKSSTIPEFDKNVMSQSKSRTDQKVGASHQGYSDTHISRMGFRFYESERIDDENDVTNVIASEMFNSFKEILNFIYDNKNNKDEINKLFLLRNKSYDELTDDEKSSDIDKANRLIKKLKEYAQTKSSDRNITVKYGNDIVNTPKDNDIISNASDVDFINIGNSIIDIIKKSKIDKKQIINFVKKLNNFLSNEYLETLTDNKK
jgi:hypothetical protein